MQGFHPGDRVHHRAMKEYGTVTIVEHGIVHVTYDRKGSKGDNWQGAYDKRWFELHPDVLIVTDKSSH